MTTAQAQRLGRYIARARQRAGLSVRQLETEHGVPWSWVARLERGHFERPDPSRLARLAEALAIDPKRLDALSGGQMSRSLPETRTYFRAKYGELSEEQAAQIERYVERLRKKGADQ